MTIRSPAIAAAVALGAVAVLAPAASARAQGAGGAGISRQDYEACQAREETSFREAVERITVKALANSISGLDYRPIVAEAWRKGNIDDIMMRRVDVVVLDELKQETSWGELIASLASRETQEKLAKAAAERVYTSAEMRRAIETLAVDVGRTVGERLELATVDAAEPTTRCLETFLGPRYGTTVARIVATDAGKEFAIDAAKGAAPVSRGSVLLETKEGLAGLVAVIMRRQLANLSTRVGQRLVGAVLGRVVSVVAGGVGVVLIAKDIWELRNGVLPIIATEMKAPATRDKVQAELASSVAAEIEAHVKEIGRRTSERIVEILHEFRRAHAKVLELAERNAAFKAFIESIDPRNLGRLDELVALQLAEGGEARLLARVADGSFAEAVGGWSPGVLEIARDRRSLEAGFRWRALAGDALIAKIIEFEVHRRSSPDALTRAGLVRVLGLEDRVAIARLVTLKPDALEPLLELKDDELKRLARSLGEVELASLSGYLTMLAPPASKRLLAAIADAPSRMQAISPAHVREAIFASRDQSAALSMMLRSGDLFNVNMFVRDVEAVRSGAVAPQLLMVRYPWALGGLAVLGVGTFMLLWRAVVGRRPRRPEGPSGA